MAVPQVIVAGHICLDIIPTFPAGTSPVGELLVPGKLLDVGPAILSTGGAVPNTGLALHRLGLGVALMGKVAPDLLGRAILDLLRAHGSGLADGMIVADGGTTSYSVVISPPGTDRIFLHCPGANDTFEAADIDYASLPPAKVFHFGYPPLMKRMYDDGGEQLASIFRQVKSRGLTTSLDLARPDPASPAGKAPWEAILRRVLPHVDVFLPSVDELLFMLDPSRFDQLQAGGQMDPAVLSTLSGRLLDMGAGVVVLKLGADGCYVRTSPRRDRVANMGAAAPADLANWTDRELLSPCFLADVAGTTGAGDCTIAGFLAGLVHGLTVEDALTAATAVGACSVETADATSGVRSWKEVQARVAAGWRRRPVAMPLTGWSSGDRGLFVGPRDIAKTS